MIYTDQDYARLKPESNANSEYRSEFRRDYARLLHSPSFRRLAGKTQLFPGQESDYFRNRLTHSLEVAQIAKSITLKINYLLKSQNIKYAIDTDLVEFSALAHDIGHPPFGHSGETALDKCMVDYGGFEGNAQSLRQLVRIERGTLNGESSFYLDNLTGIAHDKRIGLNLAFRSISSFLKYDFEIPHSQNDREKYAENVKGESQIQPVKGYYSLESQVVKEVKARLGLTDTDSLKTIECRIMDFADDISYSVYDLDDALKGGFISFLDIFQNLVLDETGLADKLYSKLSKDIQERYSDTDIKELVLNFLYYTISAEDDVIPEAFNENRSIYDKLTIAFASKWSDYFSKDGYFRRVVTSSFVNAFISGISINESDINTDNPRLSKFTIDDSTRIIVEWLKYFTYHFQISSPKLKIAQFRSFEIVETLFKCISSNPEFMPRDFYELYCIVPDALKIRIVCDYIAGMTDSYAIRFYGRLKSENPETIFKQF